MDHVPWNLAENRKNDTGGGRGGDVRFKLRQKKEIEMKSGCGIFEMHLTCERIHQQEITC